MLPKKTITLIAPLVIAATAVFGYTQGNVSSDEALKKVSAAWKELTDNNSLSAAPKHKPTLLERHVSMQEDTTLTLDAAVTSTRRTSDIHQKKQPSADISYMPGLRIAMTPGWLSKQEGGAHGGHTLERHVGKSNDYLRKRLTGETGLRPIRSASTFLEQSTAEDIVARILLMYDNRIITWLNDNTAPDTLALEYRGTRAVTTGKGIRAGDVAPSPRYNAKAVLRKSQNGYGVLTAYPM